ncbi:MAG: DNA repair protein RadA [Eubacterium sp.]|nr:DNA repair protein RadA [Eubacterium sp.]
MAKASKTLFFCKECGYESAKWMGFCPSCKASASFVEAPVVKGKGVSAKTAATSLSKVTPINDIDTKEKERLSSGYSEFDRVLGGGIVPGSLVLVGGDPGIGKSTLLLQVMKNISEKGVNALYVSGEESLAQIKLRADRIGEFSGSLKLFCETNLDAVEQTIVKEKPDVAVIDSIQTMYQEEVSSAPGSVTQVKEATAVFMRLAKEMGITIFLVGHVTKEGSFAGPRMLEHMVDTVLYFEGDRYASYRIIRGVKNRFGSTNEIGVFEMKNEGMTEVKNPSEYMLSGRAEGTSGSVISCSMEGTRPILIEIQALVTPTNFGLPRRTCVGTDINRMNLLIAVLEKRGGYHLSNYDAYVNIAGGMRLSEPAVDMGVCLALLSSFKDKNIDDKTVVFGEIGLGGEVRGVGMAARRVQEAKKLGFAKCILPKSNLAEVKDTDGITLVGVNNIRDAARELFG